MDMNARDLRTEAVRSEQDECRRESSQGGVGGMPAAPTDHSKHSDYLQTSTGKMEVPTTRPCAVIGPDRVLPQPAHKSESYAYPAHADLWPTYPENTYLRYPIATQKFTTDQRYPPRNISPRQTFQENMQRIMMPPRLDPSKISENPANTTMERSVLVSKNVKMNSPADGKHCEVPYVVNSISNEQRTRLVRNGELYVPNIPQGIPPQVQSWAGPNSVPVAPQSGYCPPELNRYPYASCAMPRPAHMPKTHRNTNEETPQVFADPLYKAGEIRYEPYPTPKERYPRSRYDYVSNLTNHYPPYYHPPKYDVQKTLAAQPYPGYAQGPYKYFDSRGDQTAEQYFRPHQVHSFTGTVPTKYSPSSVNTIQSKLYGYPVDGSVRHTSNPKGPYNSNRMYSDYDAVRLKQIPISENPYYAELQTYHLKPQVPMHNYINPEVSRVSSSYPYYHRDNPALRNYSPYMAHYKGTEQSQGIHNPLAKIPVQFSPNVISPHESNLSNESFPPHAAMQEDCGYISQTSTASGKSLDITHSRLANYEAYYRKYDHRIVHPSSTNKPREFYNQAKVARNSNLKDNKNLDVRQFLSMWDETFEESSPSKVSSNADETIREKNLSEVNSNKQEELYVLGLVNVSNEELSKYEHIQTVTKLPENIKGYDNIELLDQFDEVFGTNNVVREKVVIPSSATLQEPKKIVAVQGLEAVQSNRSVSPLDVESKISQSVIHKDVGCNFEIKLCSPKQLDIETNSLGSLNERKIEKIVNSHILRPNVPMQYTNTVVKDPVKRSSLPNEPEATECKIKKVSNTTETGQDKDKEYGTVSKFCLASLPSLDSEIDLNFQEVNQQFIDSQIKTDSVVKISNDKSSHLCESPDAVNNNYTKLAKFRKYRIANSPVNKDSPPITLSQVSPKMPGVQRTNSVIIKNPDTVENSLPILDENNTFQEINKRPSVNYGSLEIRPIVCKDTIKSGIKSSAMNLTAANETIHHEMNNQIRMNAHFNNCEESANFIKRCDSGYSDDMSINAAINLSINSNNPDMFNSTLEAHGDLTPSHSSDLQDGENACLNLSTSKHPWQPLDKGKQTEIHIEPYNEHKPEEINHSLVNTEPNLRNEHHSFDKCGKSLDNKNKINCLNTLTSETNQQEVSEKYFNQTDIEKTYENDTKAPITNVDIAERDFTEKSNLSPNYMNSEICYDLSLPKTPVNATNEIQITFEKEDTSKEDTYKTEVLSEKFQSSIQDLQNNNKDPEKHYKDKNFDASDEKINISASNTTSIKCSPNYDRETNESDNRKSFEENSKEKHFDECEGTHENVKSLIKLFDPNKVYSPYPSNRDISETDQNDYAKLCLDKLPDELSPMPSDDESEHSETESRTLNLIQSDKVSRGNTCNLAASIIKSDNNLCIKNDLHQNEVKSLIPKDFDDNLLSNTCESGGKATSVIVSEANAESKCDTNNKTEKYNNIETELSRVKNSDNGPDEINLEEKHLESEDDNSIDIEMRSIHNEIKAFQNETKDVPLLNKLRVGVDTMVIPIAINQEPHNLDEEHREAEVISYILQENKENQPIIKELAKETVLQTNSVKVITVADDSHVNSDKNPEKLLSSHEILQEENVIEKVQYNAEDIQHEKDESMNDLTKICPKENSKIDISAIEAREISSLRNKKEVVQLSTLFEKRICENSHNLQTICYKPFVDYDSNVIVTASDANNECKEPDKTEAEVLENKLCSTIAIEDREVDIKEKKETVPVNDKEDQLIPEPTIEDNSPVSQECGDGYTSSDVHLKNHDKSINIDISVDDKKSSDHSLTTRQTAQNITCVSNTVCSTDVDECGGVKINVDNTNEPNLGSMSANDSVRSEINVFKTNQKIEIEERDFTNENLGDKCSAFTPATNIVDKKITKSIQNTGKQENYNLNDLNCAISSPNQGSLNDNTLILEHSKLCQESVLNMIGVTDSRNTVLEINEQEDVEKSLEGIFSTNTNNSHSNAIPPEFIPSKEKYDITDAMHECTINCEINKSDETSCSFSQDNRQARHIGKLNSKNDTEKEICSLSILSPIVVSCHTEKIQNKHGKNNTLDIKNIFSDNKTIQDEDCGYCDKSYQKTPKNCASTGIPEKNPNTIKLDIKICGGIPQVLDTNSTFELNIIKEKENNSELQKIENNGFRTVINDISFAAIHCNNADTSELCPRLTRDNSAFLENEAALKKDTDLNDKNDGIVSLSSLDHIALLAENISCDKELISIAKPINVDKDPIRDDESDYETKAKYIFNLERSLADIPLPSKVVNSPKSYNTGRKLKKINKNKRIKEVTHTKYKYNKRKDPRKKSCVKYISKNKGFNVLRKDQSKQLLYSPNSKTEEGVPLKFQDSRIDTTLQDNNSITKQTGLKGANKIIEMLLALNKHRNQNQGPLDESRCPVNGSFKEEELDLKLNNQNPEMTSKTISPRQSQTSGYYSEEELPTYNFKKEYFTQQGINGIDGCLVDISLPSTAVHFNNNSVNENNQNRTKEQKKSTPEIDYVELSDSDAVFEPIEICTDTDKNCLSTPHDKTDNVVNDEHFKINDQVIQEHNSSDRDGVHSSSKNRFIDTSNQVSSFFANPWSVDSEDQIIQEKMPNSRPASVVPSPWSIDSEKENQIDNDERRGFIDNLFDKTLERSPLIDSCSRNWTTTPEIPVNMIQKIVEQKMNILIEKWRESRNFKSAPCLFEKYPSYKKSYCDTVQYESPFTTESNLFSEGLVNVRMEDESFAKNNVSRESNNSPKSGFNKISLDLEQTEMDLLDAMDHQKIANKLFEEVWIVKGIELSKSIEIIFSDLESDDLFKDQAQDAEISASRDVEQCRNKTSINGNIDMFSENEDSYHNDITEKVLPSQSHVVMDIGLETVYHATNVISNEPYDTLKTVDEHLSDFKNVIQISKLFLSGEIEHSTHENTFIKKGKLESISKPIHTVDINESRELENTSVSENYNNDFEDQKNKINTDIESNVEFALGEVNKTYVLPKSATIEEKSIDKKENSSDFCGNKDKTCQKTSEKNHSLLNDTELVQADVFSSTKKEVIPMEKGSCTIIGRLKKNIEDKTEQVPVLGDSNSDEKNHFENQTEFQSKVSNKIQSSEDKFDYKISEMAQTFNPQINNINGCNVLENISVDENLIQNDDLSSVPLEFDEESISHLHHQNAEKCILINDTALIGETVDGIITADVCLLYHETAELENFDDKALDESFNARITPGLVVESRDVQEHEVYNNSDYGDVWIDDVACVETVVCDNDQLDSDRNSIGERTETEDLQSDEEPYTIYNSSKIKDLYGNMVNTDDMQLIETLSRTPQQDVKSKLHSKEHIKQVELQSVIDLSNLNTANTVTIENSSNGFLLDADCLDMPVVKEHDLISKDPLEDTNSIDQIVTSTKDQGDVSLKGLSYDSEESNFDKSLENNEKSCFLLKITKSCTNGVVKSYPEIIQTHDNEIKPGLRCKFTEKCHYTTNLISCGTEQRQKKLITKAAQKYIPPLKISLCDLKVKLCLPKEQLLKLKQLKHDDKDNTMNSDSSYPTPHRLKPKKVKPKFEDVLKNIDEAQYKKRGVKRKSENVVPKVIIKKNRQGSHYTSSPIQESYNPDLTGSKWQPWVILERNSFIDRMIKLERTRAVYCYERKRYVFANRIRPSFIVIRPQKEGSADVPLKYTIKLKQNSDAIKSCSDPEVTSTYTTHMQSKYR